MLSMDRNINPGYLKHTIAILYTLSIFYEKFTKFKVKGNVHPMTVHEVPEVEWRYSSALSLTSALDRVGGQRYFPAALPPGRTLYVMYRGWVGPRAGLDLNLNLSIDMNLTGKVRYKSE
jgi:hypothetical protein